MFKIIDRYIIKKFLGTFIFSIIIIVSIAIVFDIYEKASKQATVPDGAEEAPAVVKE